MKRMLSVLLAGAAVLCAALPAAAAESAGTDAGAAQTQEETMPDSVLYCGQVQGVDWDGEGAAVRLHLTSEDQGEYVMNLSPETVWIDSEAYAASDPAALEEGETVYVFHSPVSTRSLPPQSAAYAVVRNVPQDAAAPQYHQVESVTEDGAGGVIITTDNGGLLLSAGADTVVTAYDGSAALTDLQAGDYVMAWYPLVMLSYPGQARADHLMLLPRAEESQTEAAQPLQDGALSIVLEGDMMLPVSGRAENGTAMVPVAAVAQALGYEVTYTPGENGTSARVTVESDSFRVVLDIGNPVIYGVTKIEGAVGMTAPMDYGAAPYIVDPGTTWAPAQLFEMLGRTVRAGEGTLSIQ